MALKTRLKQETKHSMLSIEEVTTFQAKPGYEIVIADRTHPSITREITIEADEIRLLYALIENIIPTRG